MGSRLTHLALHVEDLNACISFYERYCGLKVIDDQERNSMRSVCMSAPGGEGIVIQMMSGGKDQQAAPDSNRHFGFTLDSREAVDEIAARGKEEGILIWPPEEGPFPVGYLCGLNDPNGNTVEFSYGHLIEV
jgi:catechol 2,3-dioxygenase-like lactoylglutathione lyase family enzyme